MDAAAGAFDDALAGHQPQAGTVGLGGEERVEQVRQRVRIHADAFVGHPDVHPVHAIALAGMAGNQAQAAAIGHGLDRVQRQVQHDLLQLGVVGVDHQAFVLHLQFQPYGVGYVAAQQQRHRIEQAVDLDAFAWLARAAHERQHRLGPLMAAPAARGAAVDQPAIQPVLRRARGFEQGGARARVFRHGIAAVGAVFDQALGGQQAQRAAHRGARHLVGRGQGLFGKMFTRRVAPNREVFRDMARQIDL
ncbi:hypothetical protein G6F22_017458 [Rhizopus arrhizus]|nr:hypothetical protein G6F22_017458 [Rhizopus arrhizus]